MSKEYYRKLVSQMFNDLSLQIKIKLIGEVGLNEIKDFEEYSLKDQDNVISFMIRRKFIRTRKEL